MPAFQVREKLSHLLAGLFAGVLYRGIAVEFVLVVQAVFDHFVHRAFLRERSVPETKMTVRFVWGSVGVRAELGGVRKRHAATLTEFLFHN